LQKEENKQQKRREGRDPWGFKGGGAMHGVVGKLTKESRWCRFGRVVTWKGGDEGERTWCRGSQKKQEKCWGERFAKIFLWKTHTGKPGRKGNSREGDLEVKMNND